MSRRRSQNTEVGSQNEKLIFRFAQDNRSGPKGAANKEAGGIAKKGKLRNEAKRLLWLNKIRFWLWKTKPIKPRSCNG